MLMMTYRTPPRCFESVPLRKNKTAFQAFGGLDMELPDGLIKGLLYMLQVAVYLFFRYSDLCGNVFRSERLTFLQQGD
jgi:hypothetical protein